MLREDEFRTNTNLIVTVFLASCEGDPSISPRLNVTWSHEYYGDLFTEVGPISRLGIATVTLNKTTDRVARCATQKPSDHSMVVWLIGCRLCCPEGLTRPTSRYNGHGQHVRRLNMCRCQAYLFKTFHSGCPSESVVLPLSVRNVCGKAASGSREGSSRA
jgi:hypothetical protein